MSGAGGLAQKTQKFESKIEFKSVTFDFSYKPGGIKTIFSSEIKKNKQLVLEYAFEICIRVLTVLV